MGKKRKRPVKDGRPRDHLSRPSHPPSREADVARHSHPVISLYYPQVVTLRQYLLQQLPPTSKSRRRRIAAVRNGLASPGLGSCELSTFLDTTLVGILKERSFTSTQNHRQDQAESAQTRAATSQVLSTDTGASSAQEEIVKHVIHELLKDIGFSKRRPQHLLTHGFRLASGRNEEPLCSIHGHVELFPNKNVQILKQAPWPDVLDLLGCNGEGIMIELLRDCGTFTAVDCRKGIYYQLSGLPLSTLELAQKKPPQAPAISDTTEKNKVKPPANKITTPRREAPYKANSIVFFRRRMLYARRSFNPKGMTRYGLPCGHVLNCPSSSCSHHTVHIMKYVFPKQFGLENVFTSITDGMAFKDFTSRKGENDECEKAKGQTGELSQSLIPKRLRGKAVDLVRQLQTRHNRCSYGQLLRYYCPPETSGPWKFESFDTQNVSRDPKSSGSENLVTQYHDRILTPTAAQTNGDLDTDLQKPKSNISKPKLSLTDYATPASSVSAFCRAVLRKLISSQWYGVGEQGNINQDIVLKQVDRFVRMRRSESLSIHEISKGIKITSIPWLGPPSPNTDFNKLSFSDLRKRTELLHEFLYYIFDSILIPLIRTSFYVTESQNYRNRLFYFRHDVWHQLTEKPLADLKSSMFDELMPKKAASILSRRSLRYGSLRLLPKATGIRPILNLRRRMLVKGKWGDYLSPNVNSTISPIYDMLNYEITQRPGQLGSCLNSVGEIHTRLKGFKKQLHSKHQPLYFVKLDIQSSYDNLPQEKLMHLVSTLVSQDKYNVAGHHEMRSSDEFNNMWPSHRSSKGRRKYMGRAGSATDPQSLIEAIASGGVSRRRNTVFVGTSARKDHTTEDLLDLLDEHLQNTLVKFRNKYFRQRKGIPQGSKLSTLLCNLLYAEMERDVLGFLDSDDVLLLRLVDDFLLITTNSTLALKFLKVMIKGQPEYGVTVNPSKSLVNFPAAVNGTHIPRLVDTSLFPYCGILIDVRTLEVHKDHDKMLEGGDTAGATLSNSLTVESSKAPGRALHRKMLGSFKILMQPMYLDTSHNSITVVLSNLYANFITTAMKMYQYMRALRGRNHPTPQVVVRVIRDLNELAYRMVQTKRQPSDPTENTSSAACIVHQSQLKYLSAAAFRHVFGRKQTRYGAVLNWLDQVHKANQPKTGGKSARLAQVVRKGNLLYGSWRY